MNEKPQPHPKLAQIRAMLAKAEDPAATPEERKAYNAKALALMSKFGIERAMLAEKEPDSDKVDDRAITIEGSYALERRILLNEIARSLGAKVVYNPMRKVNGKKSYRVHLFAYASDLDRIEMLFASLSLQATNGLVDARPWVPGESVAAYRRSWLRGFTTEVGGRLRGAEKQAQTDAEEERTGAGRSVALVLADRKSIVEAAQVRAYPKLGKAKQLPKLTGTGQRDGRAAGRRADIGGPRVEAAQRQAVSA
ncbi:DUF2786 domain-containing protein [Streptomyces griseoviridis]